MFRKRNLQSRSDTEPAELSYPVASDAKSRDQDHESLAKGSDKRGDSDFQSDWCRTRSGKHEKSGEQYYEDHSYKLPDTPTRFGGLSEPPVEAFDVEFRVQEHKGLPQFEKNEASIIATAQKTTTPPHGLQEDPSDWQDQSERKASNKSVSDNKSHSESLISMAIREEYSYARLGLILGLFCIVGGIVLVFNGITGSSSLTAELFRLRADINDAPPGVVLFIVGVFLVQTTKARVKLGRMKG